MANFNKTYLTYVKPIEGFYVNDPLDKGGETYGGIARKIFPDWAGWKIIDDYKQKHGTIKRNTQISEADPKVTEFFSNLYSKLLFDKFTSQSVADVLFDWFVNTIRVYANTGRSVPIKNTQKIIGTEPDGLMGPNTLKAINESNPEQLFNSILNKRREFYEIIIKNDPTQEKYRKGWFKRLDQFKFK